MAKIHSIDIANRDGVQTARLGLSKLEKTMMNIYLSEMGVFQSEFGFPTTRHESFYLQANLELAEMGALKPIRLGGWVRAVAHDIDKAFKLVPGLRHLSLSISTSDLMIQGKFQGAKSRQDITNMMAGAVEAALAHGAQSIGVNAEDAYINTTANGIGERAGNADLVATALAIAKSKGFAGKYQLDKPISLTKA